LPTALIHKRGLGSDIFHTAHPPVRPKIGDKLKNGSTLVAIKGSEMHRGHVVLAMLPNNNHTPYATWTMDIDGSTTSGNYLTTIQKAANDFTDRDA
jgi:hypothetical protein